jgi:hypothetical protein
MGSRLAGAVVADKYHPLRRTKMTSVKPPANVLTADNDLIPVYLVHPRLRLTARIRRYYD